MNGVNDCGPALRGPQLFLGLGRRDAQRSLTAQPPGTWAGSESPHVWCYCRDTTPSWWGLACRLGPRGSTAKSAQKSSGVELHPMPQLHASLGRTSTAKQTLSTGTRRAGDPVSDLKEEEEEEET